MEKRNEIKIEDRFIAFAKAFGKRRTKKQKKGFIENVVTMANSLGYETSILQQNRGLTNIRSLIIGDIKSAKTIFLAGYDTAERSVSKRFYYPFDDSYNRRTYLLDTTIYIIIAIVVILLDYFLLSHQNIIVRIIGVVILFISIFISRGLTNTTTLSKTSSIYIMLELLKANKNKNVAFCFMDKGSYSKYGVAVLNENFDLSEKMVIYLDCLAKGDELVVMTNEITREIIMKAFDMSNRKIKIINVEKEKDYRFSNIELIAHVCLVESYKYSDYFVRAARKEDDLTVDFDWMNEIIGSLKNLL